VSSPSKNPENVWPSTGYDLLQIKGQGGNVLSYVDSSGILRGNFGNTTADTHPSSPTTWDDEFEGNTLNSKWTLGNSPTVSLLSGSVVMSGIGVTSGDVWTTITQPLTGAGTQWTFACKLGWVANWANSPGYARGAVCILMTDGTKLKVLGMGTPSGTASVIVENFSNYTTYAGAVGNSPLNIGNSLATQATYVPEYFRIRNDGTNWNYEASINGIIWGTICSEAVNTYLTPTAIGIGIDAQASQSNVTCTQSCDWFRKTQ
jgi:hypothetical protein